MRGDATPAAAVDPRLMTARTSRRHDGFVLFVGAALLDTHTNAGARRAY